MDFFKYIPGFPDTFDAGDSIAEIMEKIIFNLFGNFCKDIYDWILKQLNYFVFSDTTIDALKKNIFDFGDILVLLQTIAGSLLIFLLALEIVERQGSALLGGKDDSFFPLIGKTILSGMFIYLIPNYLLSVLLKINNYLVDAIMVANNFNVSIYVGNLTGLIPLTPSNILISLASIIVVVAFVVLVFHAAIRYIELILAILIAPILCALFIKDSSLLSNWLKETCAIVFTQVIHVLLMTMAFNLVLKDAMGIEQFFSGNNAAAVGKFISFIGIIIVAIRGPRVLRQYLFASGVGGGALAVLGTGGRMVANRIMLRKILSGGKL